MSKPYEHGFDDTTSLTAAQARYARTTTPKFTIEVDEHVQQSICPHCGHQFSRVHGFLYRDGDALAVYWADLYKDHPEHPQPRAVLTVALGDDWSDTGDPSGHAWVELNVWLADNEIQMSFMDVKGDLDAAHFGLPLNREAALADPDKDAFLAAADEIVYQDERVAQLLGARR